MYEHAHMHLDLEMTEKAEKQTAHVREVTFLDLPTETLFSLSNTRQLNFVNN